jgi:hypothetical protein
MCLKKNERLLLSVLFLEILMFNAMHMETLNPSIDDMKTYM